MRPFRFALHLKEYGWEPTVLTIEAPGQHLTAKEERLLDGVETVRLRTPFDRSTAAESQLGLTSKAKRLSADEAGLGADTSSAGRRNWKDVLDWLDRQFPVDTWLLLFALRYRRILQTVRCLKPNVIWSTGDPWSSLVVARQLSNRFNLPWVADFRDPWTLSGVRGKGKSRLTRAANRWCERRVLEDADAVLFQATQTEQKYRRHYADLDLRTETIFNSYDPDVFEDPVAIEEAPTSSTISDDEIHLGFFGRFREMSPAEPIVDALAAARARYGDLVDRLHVHSFGPLNAADARYAEEKGVLDQFHRRDAVPLEEALSALRQFDLLLVSTHPRRNEIIPAKLLEYLAAGRPVLSLSNNPEVGRILARTGTGVQLPPENTADVGDLLVNSLKAKQAGRPLPISFAPVPDEIRRFAARPTTEQLAQLFDSIASV